LPEYGYGQWPLVLWNVLFFSLFLLFIPFKRKVACRSISVYVAFLIALFTEMYGFPLTIYILTWLFGYQNPLTHLEGHLLASLVGHELFFSVFRPLSDTMIAVGGFLIILGWRKIHKAKRRACDEWYLPIYSSSTISRNLTDYIRFHSTVDYNSYRSNVANVSCFIL
jgi:hypothetical protein